MAIINEGYFAGNSETVCTRVSVCELEVCVGVCVCVVMMGRTRWGDEPLCPEGTQL